MDPRKIVFTRSQLARILSRKDAGAKKYWERRLKTWTDGDGIIRALGPAMSGHSSEYSFAESCVAIVVAHLFGKGRTIDDIKEFLICVRFTDPDTNQLVYKPDFDRVIDFAAYGDEEEAGHLIVSEWPVGSERSEDPLEAFSADYYERDARGQWVTLSGRKIPCPISFLPIQHVLPLQWLFEPLNSLEESDE